MHPATCANSRPGPAGKGGEALSCRPAAHPVVDIVIDNFNYGRFLAAAIDSALAQTHPRTRVTVVDDGSTDDSLAVARAYGDRIAVIAKANGGQASALNAGAAATAGELVAFLDADDQLEPDFATTAVRALAANPAATRVALRAVVVDSDGMATGLLEPSAHLPLSHGDLREATLRRALDLTWPPLSANVFRRSALERVLPIPEDRPGTLADWYLVHATALLGPVVAVEQPGARYRRHGDNAYLLDPAGDRLEHVRKSIALEQPLAPELERIARAAGISRPRRAGVATATAARRLISLRLDPERHPVPGDTVASALRDGLRCVRGNRDLAVSRRAAIAAWLALMASAPRPVASRLADVFLFPDRRRRPRD